jgi:hypothetical protein
MGRAVALDEFAFGRQLLPGGERVSVDAGSEVVGDLPVRRSWVGGIDTHGGQGISLER